jgi:hypothetical protein
VNIVLYESEHFETLEALVRLFDTGAHRIHLLIPRWMENYLDPENQLPAQVHWLPDTKKDHPKAAERVCRQTGATLLVLGTVSFRHWQFAQVCRRLRSGTKSLLFIHDIRDLFEPLWGTGIRNWVQYFGRLRLRRLVSAYAVLLEEIKSYILHHYRPGKPVYVIPGSFYGGGTPTDPDPERLLIAVPGSVDTTRRDYTDVEALARYFENLNEQPGIQISLLGGVTERTPSWVHTLHVMVRYEPGGLTQEEFDREMQASELVWLPLAPEFRRDGSPTEYYGSTKSSGAFFDALRYGKPLLLPDGLPVPQILASATIYYSDATYLRYLLLELKKNLVARRRLQAIARGSAEQVTLSSVRARVLPSLTGSA